MYKFKKNELDDSCLYMLFYKKFNVTLSLNIVSSSQWTSRMDVLKEQQFEDSETDFLTPPFHDVAQQI